MYSARVWQIRSTHPIRGFKGNCSKASTSLRSLGPTPPVGHVCRRRSSGSDNRIIIRCRHQTNSLCNLPLSLPPYYHLRPYHRQYTGRTVTRGTLVKGVNMHAMWYSAERRTAACHEGDTVCVFPPQNRLHLPPALRSCPYTRAPQSKPGRCLHPSLSFLPL